MKHKVIFSFHTNDHEYNMGIGFLSSLLRQRGIECEVVIYREIEEKGIVDSPDEVAKKILDHSPTIAAFSVMTFNWHRVERVIQLLRKEYGYDGLILVGGYHAILAPEEVLSCQEVDAVCIGEGEKPFLEVIEHYDEILNGGIPDIKGIVFNRDGLQRMDAERWLIENLEDYPYMDYDIFEREGGRPLSEKFIGTLSIGGIFSLAVITGRGCPYRCTYCSNSALLDYYGGPKRFVRRYSPEVAARNIKGIIDKYRPEFIEFLDETFTLNKRWVLEFCDFYQQLINTPFAIMTRIDRIDEETIARLAETGLRVVFFGIESGDEQYRFQYLNRKMRDTTIKEGARLLKKYGILLVTFNMFGMPFENRETIKKTFDLNLEIEPDAAIPFIYQPFPKTELAKMAYDNKMVLPRNEDRWDYCSLSLDTPELPASYVSEVVEKFKERFTNPERIERFYSKLKGYIQR